MDDSIKQAPLFSGYDERTTADEVIRGIDLTGKTAIVTGGYAGMGCVITKVFAQAGATVIVPARNVKKAEIYLKGIPDVEIAAMDLMNPDSIDAFADWFTQSGRPLHILINNAGVMTAPLKRDARGNISQFSTNNLGHFQLTAKLWPALKRANGARVVSVSSRAHRLGAFNFDDPNFDRREYNKEIAYAESKTGNILFTAELDRRGQEHDIRAFAVHPGMVPHTNFGKENGFIRKITTRLFMMIARFAVKEIKDENGKPIKGEKPFFKTVEQGAATAVWCATNLKLNHSGGVYCEDSDIAEAVSADSLSGKGVRPWALDIEQAQRFWEICEQYTGIMFVADQDSDKFRNQRR